MGTETVTDALWEYMSSNTRRVFDLVVVHNLFGFSTVGTCHDMKAVTHFYVTYNTRG